MCAEATSNPGWRPPTFTSAAVYQVRARRLLAVSMLSCGELFLRYVIKYGYIFHLKQGHWQKQNFPRTTHVPNSTEIHKPLISLYYYFLPRIFVRVLRVSSRIFRTFTTFMNSRSNYPLLLRESVHLSHCFLSPFFPFRIIFFLSFVSLSPFTWILHRLLLCVSFCFVSCHSFVPSTPLRRLHDNGIWRIFSRTRNTKISG